MTVTFVMVTYNRLELLKQSLKSHLEMRKKFDDIVIVDNNSTDGTRQFLDDVSEKINNLHVIHLSKNIGGAGGFSSGIEYALQNLKNEWIFLADDDAFPDYDMLENLMLNYNNLDNKDDIAAISTSVINNNKIDLEHRRCMRKKLFTVVNTANEEMYNEAFYVDEASFVGLQVKTEVVRAIGIPNKDLFIYFDDTDYSYRIREKGQIICFPTAKMTHNLRPQINKKLDWRRFYSIRNYIILLKKYYPKRYYRFFVVKTYLSHVSILAKLLRNRSKNERKMCKAAIKDGLKNHLGICKEYKPN